MTKTPEKDFLLTLFVTERVCIPIKARTLSEAKDKLLEAYMNGDIDSIETREVYEGDVHHFAEPLEIEEWFGVHAAFRNITGTGGQSRKVK